MERDWLTGLFNRRAFDRDLSNGLEAATAKAPLSLVLVDLDGFKSVNDEHGHQLGDRVLQAVAKLLEKYANERGRAYRFGGEEFMLILKGHTAQEAAVVADKLREHLQAAELTDARIKITVSAGVASFPADAGDIDRLVECADKACYRAKKMGRNRVCVFRESGEDELDAASVREPRPRRPPHLPPKSHKPTI